MAALAKHVVDDTHKDFLFTEEHQALWEVSEEKAILDQGVNARQKDLAAQNKEREKTRVKGKLQTLKGETQLQKEILANADKVEEEGATAKALRAGDKAEAAVMKEQEQHDDDYDPDEDNEDNTSHNSTSSTSSSNSSSSNSSSGKSSKTSEQSTTNSSSTDEKKKKKKKGNNKKKSKSKPAVAKGNTRQKRPAASQGGRPKKR